jgi:hypothetical protein
MVCPLCLPNLLFLISKQHSTMDELYHRLDALTFYARSPLQYLVFEPGMNWWWIYPSNNIREQVKYSVHPLEQVFYMDNDESFGKVKLSVLLERKFGDKYSVVPYNKKLFVTVIGLVCEDQGDCSLPSTLVRDQGKDKNNKWMDLKKNIARAAEITLMQQKAVGFLKESAAKERAEALKATSAAVSITKVMMTTTVLIAVATTYVQSQQYTSSFVMFVAAATTPLMACQIFHDFLISTCSKKLPVHESIKNCKSYSS